MLASLKIMSDFYIKSPLVQILKRLYSTHSLLFDHAHAQLSEWPQEDFMHFKSPLTTILIDFKACKAIKNDKNYTTVH